MGPSALRYAGVHDELRRLGHVVYDSGNLTVAGPEQQLGPPEKAKFIHEIARTCNALGRQLVTTVQNRRIPLVVGGDHSIAMGTAWGLAQSEIDFGLLWIDAHADINTPTTSPSGNVHGMPIAAMIGLEPAAMMKPWLDLAATPPLTPDRIVLMGVRDVDPGEREALKTLGITVYTMADVDRMGVAAVIDKALSYLLGRCQSLYVSFDLDALDPGVAPGVGTPKEGGLTYRESHLVMESIAATERLCALEVVEINPILDVANKTARVATGLIASAFGASVV